MAAGPVKRPWTVYALTALWLVGFAVSRATSFGVGDPDQVRDWTSWVDVALFLAGVGIIAGLWRGKTWAYSLTLGFMVLGTIGVVAYMLFGGPTFTEAVWPVFSVGATIYLLLHPLTRRFAGSLSDPGAPRTT